MNRRISPAVALALLATALTLAAGATTASAADQARVRLYYLSPDGPHVDFYVDGAKAWSDIAYKTVSTYAAVAAGQHHFQVRPAGSAPSSQPLADVQQSVDANAYYTVFAGGKASELKAGVFPDGFPNPPAGKAVARFVHMAPEVPGVDVKLKDGTTLFSNVSFLQTSPYSPFPAGSYNVQLVGVSGSTAGQVLFTTTATLGAAGVVYSLVGTGGVGQPVELVQTQDAASAGASPQGGAGTGEGGLAYRAAFPVALVVAGLAGAALVLLLVRRAPAGA
jgi:hypothetical protein